MSVFQTSFSNNLTLRIDDNVIYWDSISRECLFREMLIIITDFNNKEYLKEQLTYSVSASIRLPSLSFGNYKMSIYIHNREKDLYFPYLYNNDLILYVDKEGVISFAIPKTLSGNSVIYNEISKNSDTFMSSCLEESVLIQKNHPQITSLAKSITKGKLFAYLKVLAIHDWVAQNIYYDFDALKTGRYVELDPSALGVLSSRKSVCQGYSNLSIALLRALGIPAYPLLCFALGVSSTGTWSNKNNMESNANHQITLAYVNNRWLIMDETWDSNNRYENGKYIKDNSDVSRKYFDSTINFISNTHRFV